MTTYLMTGATGNIGGRVVERLLARGERPRVLARSEEKVRARFGNRVEVSVGDLGDAASLSRALSGVDAIFLVNVGPSLALRDGMTASAAKAQKVKHIVKLSSLDADGQRSTLGAWHAQGEAAIRESGVAWTFVRPTGFMSNALAWAPSIKAEGILRASTGEGKTAMIHPDDIADVATRALTSGEWASRSLKITGPRALTYAQMTAEIAEALGKSFAFESISDEQARARLAALPPALADGLVALWRSIREGQGDVVTDTVERVTGRAPTSFAQWARQNAAAFAP